MMCKILLYVVLSFVFLFNINIVYGDPYSCLCKKPKSVDVSHLSKTDWEKINMLISQLQKNREWLDIFPIEVDRITDEFIKLEAASEYFSYFLRFHDMVAVNGLTNKEQSAFIIHDKGKGTPKYRQKLVKDVRSLKKGTDDTFINSCLPTYLSVTKLIAFPDRNNRKNLIDGSLLVEKMIKCIRWIDSSGTPPLFPEGEFLNFNVAAGKKDAFEISKAIFKVGVKRGMPWPWSKRKKLEKFCKDLTEARESAIHNTFQTYKSDGIMSLSEAEEIIDISNARRVCEMAAKLCIHPF